MNKKLKCAVVGVGYLGEHHARIYSQLENTQLVAVMDANEDRAREIAEKFSCKVAHSLEEIASLADAISIVVPSDKHTEVALELLDRHCHLLIEKPICTSVEDASRIIEKAKEENLLIQVGHIEHFNPVFDFAEAKAGFARYITTDRQAPFNPRGTEVSVVLDLMIHDIGVVLALVNSEIESIEAVGASLRSKAEDIANASIKFKNSCVANLNVSRLSTKRLREINIYKEDSHIALDFANQQGRFIELQAGVESSNSEILIEKSEPLKRELYSFANCILKGESPKVDATLAKKSLELALEIIRKISLC